MSPTQPILPECSVLPPMTGNAPASARPNQRQSSSRGKATKPRKGTAGRFGLLNAFVDFTAKDLTRAESLVWLILFRDTKGDGIARTGQADIARRAGVDVSTVKRAIKRLTSRGLLHLVFRGSLRKGPSAYRVLGLSESPEKVASKGAWVPP